MARNIKSLFTASKTMRMFMFNVSVLMLVGITLTGYDKVHWFLYVVPAFFCLWQQPGYVLGWQFRD